MRVRIDPTTILAAGLLVLAQHAGGLLGQAAGPGVPSLSYPQEEVFTAIGRIRQTERPRKHGAAVIFNGYLVIPVFEGLRTGGYRFYDISDPRNPRLAGSVDQPDVRESHAIGFSYSYPGLYAVTQGSFGIHFWDWTDVKNPAHLAHMPLPDIEASDYDSGVWWLFWQAPYVYVSGTSRGLYIVDATDPQNPLLTHRMQTHETGGFRLGSVFAIGNLLVLTANDQVGFSTLDISDPAQPILLSTERPIHQYSSRIYGDQLLLAANTAGNRGLVVFDISDPSDARFVQMSPLTGQVAYLTVQDGFAHVGNSVPGYFKIDLRDPAGYPQVGTTDFPEAGVDLDYATVAGNLVFLGDDNGFGTLIVPHQSAADTTGPLVNRVCPKAGAVDQALTTRVGLTFTDQIDLRTIDSSTFLVRPVGGEPLAGKYSGQTGIVNFFPETSLDPSTTYEVIVPAGGVRDCAGNPVETGFTSVFSTGPEISLLACRLLQTQPVNVLELATFRVESCSSEDPVLLSWDFGDGSDPTPFSPALEVSHTYSTPGHYPVIVVAMAGSTQSRATVLQTVTLPTTPASPTHATSILLDESRGRVWNVNPDNDTVTSIDTSTFAKILEQPVGSGPTTLALGPDDTIWVSNRSEATISVLRRDGGGLEDTIDLPYGSQPHGIAFDPSKTAAYVTLEGTGELARIDPRERKILQRVDVGRRPRGLAISHDDSRIFVARFISPQAHGEVVELGREPFEVTRVFELAADPGPDTESSGHGIPNYLLSLTISPDGHRLWVPSKKDNTRRGALLSGEALTFENTVRSIVSQIDLLANEEQLGARRDLNNRALPSAVALTSRGDFAFVATLGSNTVDILDAYSGQTITSIEDLALAPRGLALSADDRHLFVHSYMAREVSVYDVTEVARGNVLQRLATVKTVAAEKLTPEVLLGKQIFYNSADDRMARDNYISCATCHLDGGSDQRVWDFTARGEGLRNTTELKGRAGMGHGPVHWSANFDEIQDFEHDMRQAFEGQGFLSTEDLLSGTRNTPLGDRKAGLSPGLDALAAYVSSLTRVPASPFRNPDGSPTADAIKGAEIFHSGATGCADCHTGSRLTDSRLDEPFLFHEVGTIRPSSGGRLGGELDGIDTPTLRGVWATAPYLHDGSAATVLAVLTSANPDDLHGETSPLSETELAQLTAYLLQLEDAPTPVFRRGNVNDDDFYDLSDSVQMVNALFRGELGELRCFDAADTNDDGRFNISDPIYALAWFFLGKDPPPAPGPQSCGPDPTPDTLPECEDSPEPCGSDA